jgi:hypothetical protein
MRLENYIAERSSREMTRDDIIKIIKSDCRPFLRKLDKNRIRLLYRGTQHWLGDFNTIKKFIPRKHRKPSDMNELDHEMLNKSFYKKFGWKPRSEGVFCTGSSGTASGYGNDYIFFPIGDFEFVWSPTIDDLYDYTHTRKPIGSIFLKDFYDETVDKYINSGLATAIAKRYEIMVRCNSYYLTNMNPEDIIEALEKK